MGRCGGPHVRDISFPMSTRPEPGKIGCNFEKSRLWVDSRRTLRLKLRVWDLRRSVERKRVLAVLRQRPEPARDDAIGYARVEVDGARGVRFGEHAGKCDPLA